MPVAPSHARLGLVEAEGPRHMAAMTNADQIAAWSGPAGQTWADLHEELDRQVEPPGRAALELAAPAKGERALDVGCGPGATTLELARAVGPEGAVAGVDVAPMLLQIARRKAAGVDNVSFVEADAQAFVFEPGHFDLIFSRFGVMFFDDPVAAFANLRRACRSGGRLAFVCWRSPADNPLFRLGGVVVAELFPDRPAPPPNAPGPFAFADDGRVRAILSDSGWHDVRIEALDVEIGGANLDESVAMMTRAGPLGAALREMEASEGLRRQAADRLRPLLEPYAGPDGVRMPAACWLVAAAA